ncbi:right-handed parallel beta-helix repeat-containing protein [Pedobacter endophyticus]|uniref:Right-handed parallel beta-helix repeat-containing protein n=1 Tax=Pedobacter endophyticus TaxID=2789740 RepID=A0A7S9PZC8_9SPHI|nr:right-handed parallel beta-helix repeat-containing protein [Pedobacter endophyticus]QPH40223.1 right-handed parallel beta-helix repeat-containing protein [Pedobacter endophyticus]
MKKISLTFLLMITLLYFRASAIDIYVSMNGADTDLGTKEKPLATLHSAIRKARELRRLNDPAIKNGINIFIEKGFYQLYEPVVLRPEDSGTKESPTEIIGNGHVVLSGGVHVKGWKKLNGIVAGLPKTSAGKVWVTDVPNFGGTDLQFRQLWVNGTKAIRAKSYNGDAMGRILSWDKKNQTCKIPLQKNINIANIKGMEMLIHQWWAIANLRVKSVKISGNSAELSFLQPESRIQSEHPWPAPWISEKTGNSAFYLSNAIQFLDEPGEWFEDLKNHKLYYWPKAGENMLDAEVIAPALETLVKIEGTIDRPVSFVHFKGISFKHSTWLRPSQQGHVPHQAGMYMLDAYALEKAGTPDKPTLENQAWVGRPASAVEVTYAHNTSFESCRFEHLASTGLDYKKGTSNSQIKGNLFKDIGGSAILIGTFSDEATEVHLPYNPSDEREISTNDKIENNLITNVTNEDWGAVGIGAGYVRGIEISHNEISGVSYSGISMGWGWTKTQNAMKNNTIRGNKIHHYGKHMYDVAGIYTLSAQPNSFITENVVDSIYKAPYAHLPEHWFYLYTDEGSSDFTIKNNWTPTEKYLQNANGPGNLWKSNGPKVSQYIKQNAGLAQPFHYLLKEKAAHSNRTINQAEDKSVVFELIFKDKLPGDKALKSFAEENNLLSSSIYKWDNRLVFYTSSLKVESLQQTLKRLGATEIKLYDNMFYDFNREKNCGDQAVAEWDNIILSANLVKDEKMQKEYLGYHKTQFEKWPEISKGFCNAEFQRLAIFKKDRQLMLIISIPKGKSLDDLNPKTTENNPKVDEWNAIMKNYQEGIEGTKPDEVWVFFKPIE